MAARDDLDEVLDIYHHTLLALDSFELRRLNFRSITVAGVRLDLLRRAGGRLAITCVRAEGGQPATMVRAVCDFADVLGWTLLADPADIDGVGEDPQAFLARFEFVRRFEAAGLLRLPRPLPWT